MHWAGGHLSRDEEEKGRRGQRRKLSPSCPAPHHGQDSAPWSPGWPRASGHCCPMAGLCTVAAWPPSRADVCEARASQGVSTVQPVARVLGGLVSTMGTVNSVRPPELNLGAEGPALRLEWVQMDPGAPASSELAGALRGWVFPLHCVSLCTAGTAGMHPRARSVTPWALCQTNAQVLSAHMSVQVCK